MKFDYSIVSGGFDPLHFGHLLLINAAKKYGEKLIVLLNSDKWLERKKGFAFQQFIHRQSILGSLRDVDQVMPVIDEDDTCVKTLWALRETAPSKSMVFCNGGDRTADNIPESSVSGIHLRFGVGGADKANSSQWITASGRKVDRDWGYYIDHHREKHHVLKTLVVFPFRQTSRQYHDKRSEFWYVREGQGILRIEDKVTPAITGASLHVPKRAIHQIISAGPDNLVLTELQYGQLCSEEDIVRL